MRVRRLLIDNFRGVSRGVIDFAGHTLLVGGNNIGKSTVCEALDLVLGPERLYRKPVVDEHDFHLGKLVNQDDTPTEIRIEAILVDLSEEAIRRFTPRHLRRWDDKAGAFADEGATSPEAGDAPGIAWALPVVFLGRYDPIEDDFVGDTFFDHPYDPPEEPDPDETVRLGHGRDKFTRDHKRLCGFVFLRTMRTGSRALSLQRGSLLDTILRLGGEGMTKMWHDTLVRLREMDPGVGEIEQLKKISDEIRGRMASFVNLAPGDEATAFFASDLTREHLREVVRLFVATEPCSYLVPFQRLGTGSINLLVFALLTFIAELKDKQSVIFAMEEPEIALPPHTQRRMPRFLLGGMGQTILTSHSPYVIEQFQPEQIVILDRNGQGALTGAPVQLGSFKSKTFARQRKQFAEALLSRAVLVVEGDTELVAFPAASTVMERSPSHSYTHFDLAGVSVFNAGSDGAVFQYGPLFRSLGKTVFAFYDKPNESLSAAASKNLASFDLHWESPEKGIEALLTKQMPIDPIRRFLEDAKARDDYPKARGELSATMPEADIRNLALNVLRARKGDGYGYAELLIEQCQDSTELPPTIRTALNELNELLIKTTASVSVGSAALTATSSKKPSE